MPEECHRCHLWQELRDRQKDRPPQDRQAVMASPVSAQRQLCDLKWPPSVPVDFVRDS